MSKVLSAAVALATVILVGCSPRAREVIHPFYVTNLADSDERALFRCPDGPNGGCAIDGLPGPDVFAAGGDATHIVVARRHGSQDEYFYFRRVAEETRGWGNNPEQVVGPLPKSQFEADAKRLGLPALVRLPR